MIRRLHANGFDQVDEILAGLARCGWWLERDAKILDFGCGSGDLVYQFRDRGFAAQGFDLFDTVKLRSPSDAALFAFQERTRINPSDTRIADSEMKLPYETATFDFVISMTVIEHCYALDGMMRECARVLKPGGISFHLYPSRNQAIEPHFFVPFGGRVQTDWWLRLWARLGIRNESQRHMTAAEAADHNRFYLETGVAYRPDADVMSIAYKHFGQVTFVDKTYHVPGPLKSRLSDLWAALRSKNVCEQLSLLIPGRVMLTTLPKQHR
jgi:SAM-dependent methyltransferase